MWFTSTSFSRSISIVKYLFCPEFKSRKGNGRGWEEKRKRERRRSWVLPSWVLPVSSTALPTTCLTTCSAVLPHCWSSHITGPPISLVLPVFSKISRETPTYTKGADCLYWTQDPLHRNLGTKFPIYQASYWKLFPKIISELCLRIST